MPQIPTYQLQANPPQAQPFQVTKTGAAAQAGQIDDVGYLLQRRGEQLAEQYDTVQATQAYNQWRDEERDVLANKDKGLLTREGTNAYGVQKSYDEWYQDSVGKTREGGLSNARQQAMFDKLTGNHREASLNSLATHEMQQHRAAQKDSEAGYITNGIMDVRNKVGDKNVTPVTIIGEDGQERTIMERPVDAVIRETIAHVDRINGGFTNAQKKAQIEQVMRKAEIEELIDRKDFKTAKPLLEEHRAKLGEAYFGLRNAMEREEKEDRVTRMYVAGVNQFPNSPEGRIKLMDDQGWLNTNFPGWKLEEIERVKNVGKAEIQWRHHQKTLYEENLRDQTFKSVMANMVPGPNMNVKAAEEAMYRAAPNLRPQDFQALQATINTVSHNYDDESIIKPLEEGIENLTVKQESEIDIRTGHGISVATSRRLKQQLKDKWENPGRNAHIKYAEDWFDRQFKTRSEEMMMAKPTIMNELRARATKENMEGEKILNLIQDLSGTYAQLGWKNEILGVFGGDRTSKQPFAAKVLADQATMKRGGTPNSSEAGSEFKAPAIQTPQTVTEQAQRMNTDNIPKAARSVIIEYLQSGGKAVTEKTIADFYRSPKNQALIDKRLAEKKDR